MTTLTTPATTPLASPAGAGEASGASGADPTATAPPARGTAERAAVLTLVIAIVFQPILHPTGPGNSSPVDLFTIASIVTALVWLAGTHRRLRAPYFIPVALYVAAGAGSGLVSSLPTTALLTLAIDVLLFTWCVAVVNVLSAPRAMRYAVAAWSWSGIAWAALVIMGWLGHVSFIEGLTAAEGNRVMFTFGDPNYASWYWGSTILVVYAARTPARRWMRVTGYLMLFLALVLTESNGGVLALGTGIMFLILVRCYRHRGWVGVLAAGLSAGVVISAFFYAVPLNQLRQWAANSNQPLLVNSIGRSAQSSSERGLLIHESMQLYQSTDGVLGTGPASTKPLTSTLLYPYANEAHDDFLAALSERGVIGLFALILLAASVAARASPVVRRRLSAPFAAAVPRPAGIVAALIAISLNSFYEEVQHFRLLWLLFGIVAVLGRDAVRSRPATSLAGGRDAVGLPGVVPGPTPAVSARAPAAPARAPAAGPAAVSPRRAARPSVRPSASPSPQQAAHPSPQQPQRPGSRLLSRSAISNLGAQGGALAAVSVASLLVARIGGPTVLGEYALIRVLPWLFGVIFSCGLPTASAFFLAGERAKDPSVRPTLTLLAVAGAIIGSLAWLACVLLFHDVFFRKMPLSLVLVMTVLVVTQLWTVTAKACCQGSGDIPGANLVIVAEELWFLFVYPVVLFTVGYKGAASVLVALIISGALAMMTGLLRLRQRGYFAGWGAPSLALAKKVAAFGGRGQLGNMLWLMNLRFDFILLGALAGPAVLGIYAVASKVAELMRLLPTAINYVLYSRFAHLARKEAASEARHLLPRATILTLALTPFVVAAAYVGLPIIYGTAYRGAVTPAAIIVIGLSIEGAAAVSSAYLVGSGRPGLNSVGMGVGATITVVLDTLLIPRYGAMGGAITSAVTYLVTTSVLVGLARRVSAVGALATMAPESAPSPAELAPLPAELAPLPAEPAAVPESTPAPARPMPSFTPAPARPMPSFTPVAAASAKSATPKPTPWPTRPVPSFTPAAAVTAPLFAPPLATAVSSAYMPRHAAAFSAGVVRSRPPGDSRARRVVDILVAGAALTFIAPLLLLVAATVRLSSPGPAFYRQTRVGRHGKQFTMLKFRSMVAGADKAGPLVTSRTDSRVTRVGAWLRATKLDELPQLINVLRGDMTLIGPRPEVPRFISWYEAEELELLKVRPGLTGPGQIFYTRVQGSTEAVTGNPEDHYVKRELRPKLAIDLDYLKRRGVVADMTIVIRTLWLLTGLRRRVPVQAAADG